MCFRFILAEEIDFISERFEIENVEIDFQLRTDIFPGYETPIIASDGKRRLLPMQWGLIPFWAKDVKIGRKMINARAETLHEKPSFKGPLKRRRCLIPANGFYEWDKRGKEKILTRFALKEENLFAFAGLWDLWQSPEGSEICTFTIITTEPNQLVKLVHNRMPVILLRENEDKWLNHETQDIKTLQTLLQPYPAEHMRAYPESTNPPLLRKPSPVPPKVE